MIQKSIPILQKNNLLVLLRTGASQKKYKRCSGKEYSPPGMKAQWAWFYLLNNKSLMPVRAIRI